MDYEYSEPEKGLFLEHKEMMRFEWETNEAPPRNVVIKGTSGIDPDVVAVDIDGSSHCVMACGSRFDGSVVNHGSLKIKLMQQKTDINYDRILDQFR